MKVLFKSVWFGPSDVSREGKINQASGRRYRPGVHFVPAELKDALPKTAKVLEDDAPAPVVSRDPAVTLRDFDEVRAADEDAAKAAEDAELRANAEKLKRELEAEKSSKKKPGKE